MFWETINTVQDLKQLRLEDLYRYADEVRTHIIHTVNEMGGHLASNLGVVELTIALHRSFDCPKDKIIWDVGHQSYTHKIITGRRDQFAAIRTNGGISGFPSPKESDCDCFVSGHSSTSLSVGLGFAHARDILSEDYQVICVIGDGALTGGMAFEALNDIGENQSKMIIVLNDNKMSISKNVGAMSKYLTKLRLSNRYGKFKKNIKKGISALPFFGDKLVKMVDKSKDNIKSLFMANKIFENLGLKYYGPFDGHNIAEMLEVFEGVKKETKPVIIHLVTHKGSGFDAAEDNPLKYHGVNAQSDKKIIETNFSNVVGNFMVNAAQKDAKIIGITAAMAAGTGLSGFSRAFPDRYFDVGIAEQHAVTMAAGMAKSGLKPYVAIYSTFLQRAFDQIIHDVCLSGLPVRLLIDRAGVVGADGMTHQGIFDLSYLQLIPNLTIFSPKDGNELHRMLEFSLSFDGPLAIRYPKSYDYNFNTDHAICPGQWEHLIEKASNIYVLATGNRMNTLALDAENVNVVNAMSIQPLDSAFLDTINRSKNHIITLEDNVRQGGFGEAVLAYYGDRRKAGISIMAHENAFLDNRDVADTFSQSGITAGALNRLIKKYIKL